MTLSGRALEVSAAVAVGGYLLAQAVEAVVIRWLNPTEWELASVSDMVLAIALGVAVYMWMDLLATRQTLAEHQRAELVLQTQLSLAAEIQRGLLPDLPPPTDRFDCAAALQSAGRIGGDFYDFVEVNPGVWTVLIADVSGKGIPAALALGSLRSTFRALARQPLQPAQIAAQLSSALLEEWRGSPYVTCIVLTFDLPGGILSYTNAGHPPGILVGSGRLRYLDCGGPPAGLLPQACFEQEVLSTSDGDTCLLVTDGVTEALENTGCVELDLVAAGGTPVSAADLCQAVMARALQGTGPSTVPGWDDDRTVVVVRTGSRRQSRYLG
jgi:serine phosphatase RsbU (regulator of sigma subunit)